MHILEVVKEDAQRLKYISEQAVLASVHVEEKIITEIISDTHRHIEQNLESSGRVFLKYQNNQITGFILIQRFWNLSELFVVPGKHREGIGSDLLTKAISICRNSDDKGYIRVNSPKNAELFYRKHGFVDYVHNSEIPSFVVPLVYHL